MINEFDIQNNPVCGELRYRNVKYKKTNKKDNFIKGIYKKKICVISKIIILK